MIENAYELSDFVNSKYNNIKHIFVDGMMIIKNRNGVIVGRANGMSVNDVAYVTISENAEHVLIHENTHNTVRMDKKHIANLM